MTALIIILSLTGLVTLACYLMVKAAERETIDHINQAELEYLFIRMSEHADHKEPHHG